MPMGSVWICNVDRKHALASEVPLTDTAAPALLSLSKLVLSGCWPTEGLKPTLLRDWGKKTVEPLKVFQGFWDIRRPLGVPSKLIH